MTLSLWDFDWNWGGAGAGSSSATAADVTALSTLLGSSKRGDNTYQMLPADYWDARAAKLRDAGIAKVKDATVLATDKANVTIVDASKALRNAANTARAKVGEERQSLLTALKNASSIDEMKQISAKLRGNT